MGRLRHTHKKSDRVPADRAIAGRPGEHVAEGQAFQRFSQAQVSLMYRSMYAMVGNRAEAEEITARIFLTALRELDPTCDPPYVQHQLFQIAHTTLADFWRASSWVPTSSLEDLRETGSVVSAEEEQMITSSWQAERVQRLLQALPQPYRDVLLFRFILNLSLADTAERMALCETEVKVLQFRALDCAAGLEEALFKSVGSERLPNLER